MYYRKAVLHILQIGVSLAILAMAAVAAGAGADELPRLMDDRLSLTLFAADPEIVTPIGLALDRARKKGISPNVS
jgi:hypothetical protein